MDCQTHAYINELVYLTHDSVQHAFTVCDFEVTRNDCCCQVAIRSVTKRSGIVKP